MKSFMEIFGLDIFTSEWFLKQFKTCRIFDEAVISDKLFSKMIFSLQKKYNFNFNIEIFNSYELSSSEFIIKLNEMTNLSNELSFWNLTQYEYNNEKSSSISLIVFEWLLYAEDKDIIIYGNREHDMGIFLAKFEPHDDFWAEFESIFWPNESVIEAVVKKDISTRALSVLSNFGSLKVL
jgi:hypothetical protein